MKVFQHIYLVAYMLFMFNDMVSNFLSASAPMPGSIKATFAFHGIFYMTQFCTMVWILYHGFTKFNTPVSACAEFCIFIVYIALAAQTKAKAFALYYNMFLHLFVSVGLIVLSVFKFKPGRQNEVRVD
ncbi:Hypothetical_protein [Hexamita inflata]|uniref:Hypothetical_protein n=1 Tax=Hexamita inflata TaxID=28002 RepID=A0AA86PXV7_9EUKA|nr:Hypothetical protein HINF_LOCUS35706 [Hexamita inflata]